MKVSFSALVTVKGQVEQGARDMNLMSEKYGLKSTAL